VLNRREGRQGMSSVANKENHGNQEKRSLTADEVRAYIIVASGRYFASRPSTEAVRAQEERQQVIEWIDAVRELLRRTENHIADQDAAHPSRTAASLLTEFNSLMG
jgi:hypothetical protein